MVEIGELARVSFQSVTHLLDGCFLYLDCGAGEAIAANVGLQYLLNDGVVHVCALESVSNRYAS